MSQSSVPTDYSPSHRTDDQQDTDRDHRVQTLRSVLRYARTESLGAVGFVELAEMLGLDRELAELAGGAGDHPERHRRLRAAQLELGLGVDELEDREV